MSLLDEIRECTLCADHLPQGPRPIVAFSAASKIAIIGQAPGSRVHASGVPWDDPSGDRLRQWLGVEAETFYDPTQFAIVPMGFCYPGRGKSGDAPPRSECAPKWHHRIWQVANDIRLTLVIGQYAQAAYLDGRQRATLTETVMHWQDYAPQKIPLPHPSPRNNIWLKKNPWFMEDLLPKLKQGVTHALAA